MRRRRRRAPQPAVAIISAALVPAGLTPRLRGVIHHYSFYASLALGSALVLLAPSPRGRMSMAVYAVSLASCLGVSALYHRGRWSPRVKVRLGRLDHSMIFLLIAGTYTPFCTIALPGAAAARMLAAVWLGAACGIAMTVLWRRAPHLVEIVPYIVLGWLAALALPAFVSVLGWTASALLLGGGALYTVGAVIYGIRRPNPLPATFGFHEIFHCLVVAAAGLHLATIALFVLPRA